MALASMENNSDTRIKKTKNGFISISFRSQKEDLKMLSEGTTKVHIAGYPFVSLVKKVTSLAPNLQVIRIIPCHRESLSSSITEYCRELQINIEFGYFNGGDYCNKYKIRRSKRYKKERKMLLEITNDNTNIHAERLQDIVEFKPELFQMLNDYYNLSENGEVNYTYKSIAQKYNFTNFSRAIIRIKGALIYIFLEKFEGKITKGMRNFSNRLTRELKKEKSPSINENQDENQKEKLEIVQKLNLGIQYNQLSLSNLKLLDKILSNQDLDKLKEKKPRLYWVLALRFGIDDLDNTCFQTLEQVGGFFHLTRERIRQLEKMALKFLGIER